MPVIQLVVDTSQHAAANTVHACNTVDKCMQTAEVTCMEITINPCRCPGTINVGVNCADASKQQNVFDISLT